MLWWAWSIEPELNCGSPRGRAHIYTSLCHSAVSLTSSYQLLTLLTMTVATTKDWKAVSAAKQAQRDATIPAAWRIKVDPSVKDVMDVPKTCGVLTPKEIEITETPATELIEQMLAKKLTSEEVTVAFCKRAAIAQQLVSRGRLRMTALESTDCRPTASRRSSSRRASSAPRRLTPSTRPRASPLVRCTACRSRSRTASTSRARTALSASSRTATSRPRPSRSSRARCTTWVPSSTARPTSRPP